MLSPKKPVMSCHWGQCHNVARPKDQELVGDAGVVGSQLVKFRLEDLLGQ